MSQKNSKKTTKNRDITALFFALSAFVSGYALVLPEESGIIGKAFANIAFQQFGIAAYLLPIILLWYFIVRISKKDIRRKSDFLWSVLSILSLCALCIPLKKAFLIKASNGWIGVKLFPLISQLLGFKLAACAVFIIFIYSFLSLFRISIFSLCAKFFSYLGAKKEEKEKQPKILEKKPEIPQKSNQKAEPLFSNPSREPNIVVKDNSKKEPKKDKKTDKIAGRDLDYKLPPADLLEKDKTIDSKANAKELMERAELLKNTLAEFDIEAEVGEIITGPVITRYDLTLGKGMKIQSLSSIVDNLSLTMKSASIRIVPIPEKSAVGIEVPNPESSKVGLRGIIESSVFENSRNLLTIALGKMTDGEPYTAQLSSMPHLLIAGATGSGKSVSIHSIILSMLFKARPDEVKFLLIDPKRVEMPIYKDIPHLYNPMVKAADADIIVNPKEAAMALKKLAVVMEERYEKFAQVMVRNIEEYNAKMIETGGQKEFYIVVIIDELADLMLTAQKEIEDSIQRLAQMSRAVGIHLILATQRPSVNVITGIIKANFPARMSFQTTSKIDSRVVLDMMGAESLLGKGDMLFFPPTEARPIRLQGAFVSLKETQRVLDFINEQDFPRIYEPIVEEITAEPGIYDADSEKNTRDLIPALKLILERKRVSHDILKTIFGGSARASNVLSLLEIKGFIYKPEGTNKWQVNFDAIESYLNGSK
ncbi:MAG: DNA translocase FtsK [Elusimicrobiota bacterium]|jgi:S-DNA-T family DNA segregation ATPase FtsK/SpoIIIE|nr:DNA translocase FtsK [Elusimicrobiota bacterium]